jgi:hypothetical protein
MIHVETKTLPDSLRDALRALGYFGRDIDVTVAASFRPSGAFGDGYRAVCSVVNLSTGERKAEIGSWGGANMFEAKPVDHADGLTLPPGYAAIHGSIGYKGLSALGHPPRERRAFSPGTPEPVPTRALDPLLLRRLELPRAKGRIRTARRPARVGARFTRRSWLPQNQQGRRESDHDGREKRARPPRRRVGAVRGARSEPRVLDDRIVPAAPRTKLYQRFRYLFDGGPQIVISRTNRGRFSVLVVHRTRPIPGIVVERLLRSDDPVSDLSRIARFYTRADVPDWCVPLFDRMGVPLR